MCRLGEETLSKPRIPPLLTRRPPTSPPPLLPAPSSPSSCAGKLAAMETQLRGLQGDLEAARYSHSQMKQELDEMDGGWGCGCVCVNTKLNQNQLKRAEDR